MRQIFAVVGEWDEQIWERGKREARERQTQYTLPSPMQCPLPAPLPSGVPIYGAHLVALTLGCLQVSDISGERKRGDGERVYYGYEARSFAMRVCGWRGGHTHTIVETTIALWLVYKWAQR